MRTKGSRVFVITGGGSGIGRALAICLAEQKHAILIVGRRQALLDETAAHSPTIQTCCADVSTADGRAKIVDALQSTSSLRALIHNAGVVEPIEAIGHIPEAAWEQTMATNLNAPLFLTQSLLEKLNKGRVLHIGSGAAYFPVVAWAAYCVSKAGLSMLTRACQLEFSPENTAFTSVMPGIIDTDMQSLIRHARAMHPKKIEFFKRLYEDHKLLSVETVAQFLSWLLLSVSPAEFAAKEWDIYDRAHHSAWLKSPYHVPYWESE